MLSKVGTPNGFGFTGSESIGGGIPIWQNPLDLQKKQAGFTVANAPSAKAVVPGGTPIKVDEAARTAAICYRFEVYEDATDTATEIKIVKDYTKYGNLAKFGMNIMKMPATLAGTGAAYAISDIDTANADYDVITLGTTLGVALTAGDVLAEADQSHATDAALLYVADSLSYADIYVEDDNLDYSVAGVYFGAIYDRRIRKIDSVEKAGLTQIEFSQSK